MFSGPIDRFRFSISTRIALFFSFAFSLCLIFAFGFAYLQMYVFLEKTSKDVIDSKWREMAAVLGKGDIKGLRDFLASAENNVKNSQFMVRVLTGGGTTLYLKPSAQEEIFEFEKMYAKFTNLEEMSGWHAFQAVDDEDKFDLLTDKISDDVFLQVGKSSEDREAVVEELALIFGITTLVLIAASFLVGNLYAKKSLKPIRELVSTIKRIENGDLTRRVPEPTTRDELSDLSRTFNRMIARIDTLVSAMKESLDNVAHDLRTPLTRIKNTAESAILAKSPERTAMALEECAEHVNEVSELLSQLLDISEANAGTMSISLSSTNVRQVVIEIFDLYQVVAEEKEITLQSNIPTDLHWPLDRNKMKRAIANLVDNAIKYSDSGSVVTVKATVREASLALEVADQGIGISKEDLPKIWDRLFRGDRSRSTKGMGIGLSLVKSIVLAHGGEVSVSSFPGDGAVFTISLPTPAEKA